MLQNEHELIVKSQKGDNQAFGVLYDHYIRPVYNFIFYKTRHKETAEDLTSQTFLKALASIARVDPTRSFQSWIYKIAQNTVIDYYRTKKIQVNIDDSWDISDDNSDFIKDLDSQTDFKRVKKYLSKLTSVERDILIMRIWQEMPYREIAEIAGKTEGNCKVIFSRSLEKLREMMPLALFVLLLSISKLH